MALDHWLLVETKASRPTSIKMKLAQDAWQAGIVSFFSENVPFSIRSGHIYANRLVQLFCHYAHQNHVKNDVFHVYEFGSGLGLLAKHFLDQLQTVDQELYFKTIVHVTDILDQTTTLLPNLTILKPHLDRLQFQKMNALDITPSGQEKIDFCFSSYLLDSIPAYCIEIRHNIIHEVQINTHIAKDSTLLDTTVFPPQERDSQYIQNLLTDPQHRQKRQLLAPKLLPLIRESYVLEPIATSTLSESSQQKLLSFVKGKSILERHVRFNFIPTLDQHLHSCIKYLAPNGQYVISDFGLAHDVLCPKSEHLLTSYGLTQFYSVCFSHLDHIASKLPISLISTDRELDNTQEVLIVNGVADQSTQTLFFQLFKTIGYEPIIDFLSWFQSHDKKQPILLEYEQRFNSLSQFEQQDYYLLKQIATTFFQFGLNDEALTYCNRLIDLYDDLAIDGYIIAGWIHQQNQNLNDSLNCFKKAYLICKKDTLIFGTLGLIYYAKGLFEKAIKSMTLAIKYSRNNDIGNYIHCILMAYDSLQKPLPESLKHWLIAQETTALIDLPESVKMRISQLKTLV